jgi:hypothetical protein
VSEIRNKKHARNLVLFKGMEFHRGIYPTDLDAFIEVDNETFILIECKKGNSKPDRGQALALRRLVDSLKDKRAYLLLASHQSDGDIILADCLVTYFRHNGETRKTSKRVTVREFTDWILR